MATRRAPARRAAGRRRGASRGGRAAAPRPGFRHVLLPMDLSRQAERTLGKALGMVTANGARVTLLHVIQRVEDIPVAELRRFYARLERAARQRMQHAARALSRAGVAVQSEVVIGTPPEDIVRYAATNRVDLIVMASHRVDPARRSRGWGTTSYKVGILCRCPIMLVK